MKDIDDPRIFSEERGKVQRADMKSLRCALLIIALALASALQDNEGLHQVKVSNIAGMINNTVSKVIASWGEPFEAQNLTLDAGNASEFLQGTGNLSSVRVIGTSKINITQCDLSSAAMILNMTIDVPGLTISLRDYWVDMVVYYVLPMYGAGNINVELSGLKIHILANVRIITLTEYQLSNVTANVILDDMSFASTGAFNNVEFNELIVGVMNDVTMEFATDYNSALNKIFSPIFEDVLNEALGSG